jgi:hypothetical protein
VAEQRANVTQRETRVDDVAREAVTQIMWPHILDPGSFADFLEVPRAKVVVHAGPYPVIMRRCLPHGA